MNPKVRSRHMKKWIEKTLDNVKSGASSSGEITANCPFCASLRLDNRPDFKGHLYISTKKRVAHCFRCGWKGTWATLIVQVDGVNYETARNIYTGIPNIRDYYDAIREDDLIQQRGRAITETLKETAELPEDFNKLIPDDHSLLNRTAVNYLKRRQISDKMIYSGMFGVSSESFRVYILASSHYWQARALWNSEPKYINPSTPVYDTLGIYDSPGMEYTHNLSNELYVTEGIFSGLAVVAAGHSACALLGKTARNEQLDRLLEFSRPLVILLDADAHKESWELSETLRYRGKSNVRVALLDEGDPADSLDYQLHNSDWRSRLKWRMKNGS